MPRIARRRPTWPRPIPTRRVEGGKGAPRCRPARDLRRFVLSLIDDRDAAARTALPWAERAKRARGLLGSLLGGEHWRARWPLAEQKAAERVERSLDRLARLGPVDAPAGLDVFARALELALEADPARQGRMGEGVMCGPLSMGVGLDLDLVVVLGLAEGSLPAPVTDGPLLPDGERQAAGGELTLRAGTVDRQHRQLLASLAGASRHLLTVPRGDLRRSSGRAPSRWALDIAGALAGERIWSNALFGARYNWLEHIASYDAGLRRGDSPSTGQEYRLRSLLAHRLGHQPGWTASATGPCRPGPMLWPPGRATGSPASTATWPAWRCPHRPSSSRPLPGWRAGLPARSLTSSTRS